MQFFSKLQPLAVVVLAFSLVTGAFAGQQATDTQQASTPGTSSQNAQKSGIIRNGEKFALSIAKDQKKFWLSPSKLRWKDAEWALPAVGITAGLIAADHSLVPSEPSSMGRHLSDIGVFAELGGAGLLYGVGKLRNAPHARETGELSYRAAIDALIVTKALSSITQRKRPDEGPGAGDFFTKGSSFPSSHSSVAWSIATVVANEYPGWATQLLAYGTAAGVSVSRVHGGKHFVSDVFVGGALGWAIGRQVYRANHNPELPGATWGTFVSHPERVRDPMSTPSAYVPIDSWVYPLLEREAMSAGFDMGFAGLRPWTRMQCAKIVEGLAKYTSAGGMDASDPAYRALADEFALELAALSGESRQSVELESLYTRVGGISGTPLNDSYHFGQTITNDYGRPYGEGISNITGFTLRTTATPIALYVRGEYQHAPSVAAYAAPVQTLIADLDLNAIGSTPARNEVNAFRLVEAYAAFNVKSLQFTLGKQNLWWGPGESGAVLMSTNAEPIYMLRFSNIQPFQLPLISKLLGPARGEFFFGELGGHHFPADPWIHGQKVSFKPTRNLEIGFSRTVIFAGEGRPLTFRTFWNSFSSFGDTLSTVPGTASDVGDRRGGFDFSYRIPGLRKWLVLYNDAFSEDDPSPLASPRRSAWNPGFYMPQIPGIAKLDFRAESAFTDSPAISGYRGTFFYFNGAYHDAYTNKSNILGSWVGRQGHGLKLSSTYWFSPRKRVQLVYRRSVIDDRFIPQGGKLNDFRVNSDLELTRNVSMSGSLQYERWNVPVLGSSATSDVAASLQITYKPNWRVNLHRLGN